MGLGIPPLNIKLMLESNPLKPTMFVERLAVLHTRNHKSEIPLENSSNNPLNKWQSFGQCRWKVKSCWKMPLQIHDDFWGVDFWCAIFCPYRLRSQKSRVRGSNPGSTACLGLRMHFKDSKLPGAGPIYPGWLVWKLPVSALRRPSLLNRWICLLNVPFCYCYCFVPSLE